MGALTSLGFSHDEAEYYDRGVREGHTLVTVHDDEGRAEGIFDQTGADRYRATGAAGSPAAGPSRAGRGPAAARHSAT